MVDVKIIGRRRLSNKLKSLDRITRNNLSETMQNLVKDMQGDAESSIDTGSRTGRVYNTPRGPHQASAPGEFPKTDTGILAASFYRKVKKRRSYVEGILGNNAPYARAVEFKPSDLGGRPFMRPIWRRWRGPTTKALKSAIRHSINRSAR